MRPKITIPKDQNCEVGEFMKVIIDSTSASKFEVYLKCKFPSRSESYDEIFYANEFTPFVHGFVGINDDLAALTQSIT